MSNIITRKYTKSLYPYLDDSLINEVIPIAYGRISAVKCQCVNANQNSGSETEPAIYRMPDLMTDYGTPYIYVDDTFKSATLSKVDYSTGLITISNGRSTSGTTYALKLVNCKGYMTDGHSYPAAMLKHFFANYGGKSYDASNFNTTNFDAELATIESDIGFVITDTVDFWDQVFNISTKAKKICRVAYENTTGKITAKVKDYARASTRIIPSVDIRNAQNIKVTTNRDSVYSSIVTNYYHNYYDDTDLTLDTTTYQTDVKREYKLQKELELETYLVEKLDAQARADEDALRYSSVPMTAEIEVYGNLDVAIYEVITCALMPDNLDSSARVFAGNKDCLVLSVNPNIDENYNTLTVQIIKDRVPKDSQSAVRNGAFTTIERDKSSLEIVAEDINQSKKIWGYLTTPSVVLPAGVDGVVTDYANGNGTFVVMLGTIDYTGNGPLYSLVDEDDGVYADINAVTGNYTISSMTIDSGMVMFQAVYGGVIVLANMTVTRTKQGAQGATGSGSFVMITDVNETSATYPDGQPGQYNGSFYTWVRSSETTGSWVLVPTTTISALSIYSYISFDESAEKTGTDMYVIDNSGNNVPGVARNGTLTSVDTGKAIELLSRSSYVYI